MLNITKINSSLPHFYLEKPDLGKIDKGKIIEKIEKLGEEFTQFLQSVNEPKYLYWDDVRYKQMA